MTILNGKLRRRIEGLERSLAPGLHSNPHDEMMQLALRTVSTQDLEVLLELAESGKRESEWNRAESAAVEALKCAFDQEVKRAGFPSVAAFQLSANRLTRASSRRR